MTVHLDADALLRAVAHQMSAELQREGVHLDEHLIHSAAQAALGAAYGDAKAVELVHRLGEQNPQLRDVLGRAFSFLKQHPGFWVGWYAQHHHDTPLPADHPWSPFIRRTFGQPDAEHRHHGQHHPHELGPHEGHEGAWQGWDHNAWAEHHAAGFRPAAPHGGSYRGRPGMGLRRPPPPAARARQQAWQQQQYAQQQQQQYAQQQQPQYDPSQYAPQYAPQYPQQPQQPQYDPSQQYPQQQQPYVDPSQAPPPATLDPSQLQGMFSPVDGSAAPPAAAPDPGAAPVDPGAAPTTTGADPRWIRHTLERWMRTLQARAYAPGETVAQRTFLLQQLWALALAPNVATAQTVLAQLVASGVAGAGPLVSSYAASIAQLFGLPAFPAITSGYIHPGEIVDSRAHGGGWGHPAPHEAWGHEHEAQLRAQQEAYERERMHPGAPAPGWHGWGGAPGAPHFPEPPRPGAPQQETPWQITQAALGTLGLDPQHWNWNVGLTQHPTWHTGAHHPHGQHGHHGHHGHHHDQQQQEQYDGPPDQTTGFHGGGGGHGGPHFAPRGRRGGAEWWSGWGNYYGPEYVIDERNEAEAVPYAADGIERDLYARD